MRLLEPQISTWRTGFIVKIMEDESLIQHTFLLWLYSLEHKEKTTNIKKKSTTKHNQQEIL